MSQFVVSQTLSAKLDLPEFKAAVGLGVPIVALLARQSGVALSGASMIGMALLALGHVLYETHDEIGTRAGQLRQKLSWVPGPAWLVFNQHFNMVVLVLCGLLPTQWLCCVTAAYPAAKLGVARGALWQLEGEGSRRLVHCRTIVGPCVGGRRARPHSFSPCLGAVVLLC